VSPPAFSRKCKIPSCTKNKCLALDDKGGGGLPLDGIWGDKGLLLASVAGGGVSLDDGPDRKLALSEKGEGDIALDSAVIAICSSDVTKIVVHDCAMIAGQHKTSGCGVICESLVQLHFRAPKMSCVPVLADLCSQYLTCPTPGDTSVWT